MPRERRRRRPAPPAGRGTSSEGAADGERRGRPRVLVAEVTGIDGDGEALARPVERREGAPDLDIVVVAGGGRGPRRPAPGVGDRVLVRLEDTDRRPVPGRVLARIPTRPRTFVGVVRTPPGRDSWIEDCTPSGKSFSVRLRKAADDGLRSGDIVAVDGGEDGRGPRVTERLGRLSDPASTPVLVAARHGLPLAFGDEPEEEASRAGPPTADGREDLTGVPFVTIDGEDAQDFDDAVAAAPDGDGGWRVSVAIADVAHYVRPGTALDREARKRGNSTYLPGLVLPMLPEPLSNGWCSLVPDEPRAAVVAEIGIDARGSLVGARFKRALIRSRARLTYEGVQDAADGKAPPAGGSPESVEALYGAYRPLAEMRQERGALEIELGEHRAVLDGEGEVREIASVPRLDSHRLIEEFMILANVAVARHLADAGLPLLYRVHDEPRMARVEALRGELRALGVGGLKGALTADSLNGVLSRTAGGPLADAAGLAVLRAQSRAEYSPRNIGHFGLSLPCYAHFTSPIRRYADLTIHRALLRSLGLGGGDEEEEEGGLDALGHHLSEAERRSTDAERETHRRYACRLLSREGRGPLDARIVRVEPYGMFVRVEGTDTEGLLPIAKLGDDFFVHDAKTHALWGERHGQTFRLGETIRVRVDEADPVKGRVSFWHDDSEG